MTLLASINFSLVSVLIKLSRCLSTTALPPLNAAGPTTKPTPVVRWVPLQNIKIRSCFSLNLGKRFTIPATTPCNQQCHWFDSSSSSLVTAVLKLLKYVAMAHGSPSSSWIRMKLDQQDKDVSIYSAKLDTAVSNGNCITFRVKIASTIENYCFDMTDATWSTDLWARKQFTDVDVMVGPNKLQAHRVVLSARSPVLKIFLSKKSDTGKTTTLKSGADEVDFSVAEHFIKFLYTGTLSTSANNKQLLALAEIYQVETLKKICQLAVRESSNVEDITTSLLALIWVLCWKLMCLSSLLFPFVLS